MQSRTKHYVARALAMALLAAGCGGELDESTEVVDRLDEALSAGDLVDLRAFHNPLAGDWAVSTNPSFYAAGYGASRLEGRIFSPDRPQPPSTRRLYTWYSASRRDYFTTTNTYWAGSPGVTRDGYSFVRMEGYVHDRAVAGTHELQLWWSPSSADNRTTSDPSVTGKRGTTLAPDWGFARAEGYAYPPSTVQAPATPAAFHAGTMGGGPRGERDLAVFMLSYADSPMRHTNAQYDALFFGPGFPNVRDHAREGSLGAFAWRRGGVLGPYTVPDDPDTTGNESSYRHVWDGTWDGYLFLGIRSSAGKLVSALGGGGGGAGLADRYVSWENFALVDVNRGALVHGDTVAFKTVTGHFLRESGGALAASGTSAGASSSRFVVRKVTGTGQIRPADAVTLQSVATGRYLVASGSSLSLSATSPGAGGAFTLPKGAADLERQTRDAVRLAAAAGFDFARFDRNADGLVQPGELELLMIGSGPSVVDGAATRFVGRFTIPGRTLRIESRSVCGMGEDFSLASAAHELMHLLGTIDLYGASGLNQNLTLMGATIYGVADNRQVYHLDPWHKMRLGWVTPRIHAIHDPGASDFLTAVSSSGAAAIEGKRPILVYDPRRYDVAARAGEFFLVEYRNPSLGFYDGNAASRGLVVWQVRSDATGGLSQIASLTRPGGTDASLNTFGATTGVRGGNRAWTSAEGAVTLRYIDGTDAGVRVRAGADSATSHSIWVEWSSGGVVRPRVDGGSVSGIPGGYFNLDGVFPVSFGSVSVALVGGATTYTATVTSFGPTRFIARLPAAIPRGSYRMEVRNSGRPSNAWTFRVD